MSHTVHCATYLWKVSWCRDNWRQSAIHWPKTLHTQNWYFLPKAVTFCMTVNKAQGLTFKKIGMYLPQPVFSYGQLYVALSWVLGFDSIRIKILDFEGHQGELKKKNFSLKTSSIMNLSINLLINKIIHVEISFFQ